MTNHVRRIEAVERDLISQKERGASHDEVSSVRQEMKKLVVRPYPLSARARPVLTDDAGRAADRASRPQGPRLGDRAGDQVRPVLVDRPARLKSWRRCKERAFASHTRTRENGDERHGLRCATPRGTGAAQPVISATLRWASISLSLAFAPSSMSVLASSSSSCCHLELWANSNAP